MLVRIQGIQSTIIDKIKNEEYSKLYSKDISINKIMYLNKIYNKYNLYNQENKPMINILQFEIEKTLPKFIKCLNVNELKQIFDFLINLIDSNDTNLRKAAKSLFLEFVKLNLITLNQFSEEK